jgi:hypothetical protein
MPLLLTCLLCAVPILPELPGPLPVTTCTRDGRPGDPVNLVLIGSRHDLVAAFHAAGWSTADPITLRSAVRMGARVVRNRPYPAAPVSDLYLFGRAQDVAFEQAVGPSPRTRHHVRFWQSGLTADGRCVWIGAAIFDTCVGRAPATGRITHRTAPDVDTERDAVLTALVAGGGVADVSLRPVFGPKVGFNGGGDYYQTDGVVGIGVLRPGSQNSLMREGGPRRRCR